MKKLKKNPVLGLVGDDWLYLLCIRNQEETKVKSLLQTSAHSPFCGLIDFWAICFY